MNYYCDLNSFRNTNLCYKLYQQSRYNSSTLLDVVLLWKLILVKIHPDLCFISYVPLISSLNATFSHFHFTEEPLVFSIVRGQEPFGLHLLHLFKLNLKYFILSSGFSHKWLTSFILLFPSSSFTTSLVLSSTLHFLSLPSVILSAAVEILRFLC